MVHLFSCAALPQTVQPAHGWYLHHVMDMQPCTRLHPAAYSCQTSSRFLWLHTALGWGCSTPATHFITVKQRWTLRHTRTLRPSTHHPAPRGRHEELLFVLHIKTIQLVLPERSREEVGLLGYDVLAGVKVAREAAVRGRLRGQIIGLDGQFDVQDFCVSAQNLKRHVYFYIDELLILYLQNTERKLSHQRYRKTYVRL